MGKVARLLIIAGSDSGGGAGIQADLKTASALGVYAMTALTAVTAQNTVGVQGVHLLPPDFVAAQIRSVLDDIGADAVKLGMLGDAAVIRAVAGALADYDGPVVLDPVMVAKSGDPLLADDAVLALRDHLLPMASLLTPNLPEAARLLGCDPAKTLADTQRQAAALMALGPSAVLMKGGHAEGPICRDLLLSDAGVTTFEAPRQATRNTHGTGCSMASAIASEMARGAGPVQAVGRAHGWLQAAISAADTLGIGAGHGPVHHFHEVWT